MVIYLYTRQTKNLKVQNPPDIKPRDGIVFRYISHLLTFDQCTLEIGYKHCITPPKILLDLVHLKKNDRCICISRSVRSWCDGLVGSILHGGPIELFVVPASWLQRLWYVLSCLWNESEIFFFNDALNTFYLRLYDVRHMVKDHSDSEKGNPLPPHRLLLSINSKGSFICTIPQTG